MNTIQTKPNSNAVFAIPNDDRDKLARMTKADPSLAPLLAEIVARFMRSKPLPK